MKIGNNIHTTSNKKAYRKPVLEVVEIDRVVLLQDPSPGDPGPPGGPGGENYETTNASNFPSTELPTQPDYPKENPFGGGSPTYQR
ncbi:hypothetical protein BY457_105169 [Marinilabilia salmonicolor]|jgi:hypothetical protein|nr:hypothetical protein BY457_105169 [Marinilabilia salmonicolor]